MDGLASFDGSLTRSLPALGTGGKVFHAIYVRGRARPRGHQ